MNFPRFRLDVNERQLIAVAQAGETWLTSMLASHNSPAAIAAMPAVAALQARAAKAVGRHQERKLLGKPITRKGLISLSFTVPEACGLYAFLGEELVAEHHHLPLRLVRGSVHHVLVDIIGVQL